MSESISLATRLNTRKGKSRIWVSCMNMSDQELQLHLEEALGMYTTISSVETTPKPEMVKTEDFVPEVAMLAGSPPPDVKASGNLQELMDHIVIIIPNSVLQICSVFC